jgi:LssY C-terminus
MHRRSFVGTLAAFRLREDKRPSHAPSRRGIDRCAGTTRLGFLVAVVLALCVEARGDQPKAHPALRDAPPLTMTARGRAGDPVNVAFVGSEEELHRAMATSGWYPADPVTLKTSLRIAADVLERKPYPDAPVSNLFLWGRKQDVAFEQPVGNSPKQRHHVRFWRSATVDENGEPLWLGAATFDTRVELSRTTGGITHRISPDVDSERNKLVNDTEQAGDLGEFYWIEGFHEAHQGRNGGGDPYFTDGRLAVGVISLRR